MPTQSVTLMMPETMYQRLRRRADESHRSIEEETLETLAAGMPTDDELPEDLITEFHTLATLDDDALWRLAVRRLTPEESAEMEDLHREERSSKLPAEKAGRLAELLKAYENNMLIRAHAALLLKQRGHDLQAFLTS